MKKCWVFNIDSKNCTTLKINIISENSAYDRSLYAFNFALNSSIKRFLKPPTSFYAKQNGVQKASITLIMITEYRMFQTSTFYTPGRTVTCIHEYMIMIFE